MDERTLAKINAIAEEATKIESKNIIEVARRLMNLSCVSMHGPEHHALDGLAYLVAFYNSKRNFDLNEAVKRFLIRAEAMPGAMCAYWGVCGSAASVGAAMSVINGTGPLTASEDYSANMEYVSEVLSRIAKIGGPRCCKRNAFISLRYAAEYANARYGADMEVSEVNCDYSPRNGQCIGVRCPFFVK